ncbi:MAG: helix-turn-helix domain-containing protein [Melioribacteraceae bacterium]|nr:helix-turn-helix domain-containing protein [Melioribacteraceae bacterium]
MRRKSVLLMPSARKVLIALGENIKLARLRRKMSTQIVAERADISRPTLWKIEKGDSGVAMGNYVQVLFILGLEKDLLEVAKDNIFGKKLQDLQLLTKKRAPKKTTSIEKDKKND